MDSNFEKSETYKVMYDKYWKRLRDGFMKNIEKEFGFTSQESKELYTEVFKVKNKEDM